MDERSTNLLGAFVLGAADVLTRSVEVATGYRGETPAALVTIGAEAGLSIAALQHVLRLSHPGTVRLVDRLVAEGFVERRAGADGRTAALFLTATGVQRREHVLVERRRQLEHLTAALSPAEQMQLESLLEKLLGAMTETRAQWLSICRLCEAEVCPAERCPVEQRYRGGLGRG